jgi:hypothetical protein
VTHPGSQHLFAQLCQPTARLWPGEPPTLESTVEFAFGGDGFGFVVGAGVAAFGHHRGALDTYAAERIAERNKPPPF